MTSAPWFAAGKHPCANDFFRVGEDFPLAAGLARWVEAGYGCGTEDVPTGRSWRFWAGAGDLLCYGVLVDSRDGAGRRFPLLVAGEHREKGWQRVWEALPAALSQSWADMEAAAGSDCPDLATLQTRLRYDSGPPDRSCCPDCHRMPDLHFEHGDDRVTVPCPAGASVGGDVAAAAHAALKGRVGKVPSSVFIGGLVEAPRITFFYRPLSTRDFAFLWVGGTEAGDGATC